MRIRDTEEGIEILIARIRYHRPSPEISQRLGALLSELVAKDRTAVKQKQFGPPATYTQQEDRKQPRSTKDVAGYQGGAPSTATKQDFKPAPDQRFGWQVVAKDILVPDLFQWCTVGIEGLACTIAKLVHSLMIQSRRQGKEWLYVQLSRSLLQLDRDQEVMTNSIFGHGNIFMKTPWILYPALKRGGIQSAWDLSLNTWISLIAIHGADEVNQGPSRLAMHIHLVGFPKWKWSVYLIPRETLASFSMTQDHVQLMQNRYETVRKILIAPIRAHQARQGNGSMWLTKATHLSPPLVERMLQNLDLDKRQFGQPLLSDALAEVCSRDPAIFDVPTYACGRQYAPLDDFLLNQTPPRTTTGYIVPWTWSAPFDIAGYRPYNPQMGQLNE